MTGKKLVKIFDVLTEIRESPVGKVLTQKVSIFDKLDSIFNGPVAQSAMEKFREKTRQGNRARMAGQGIRIELEVPILFMQPTPASRGGGE